MIAIYARPGIDGAVAIVTGGAQGIGKAICRDLLRGGASVVIADIDREFGESTEAELSAIGPVRFRHADIRDEESIRSLVEFASSTFGRVDILVNCAAAFVMRGLDATVEDWRTMFEVNVVGYALCSRYAAAAMKKQGKGAIVNISSISAFIAQPGLLTYSTVKAAVTNLTRLSALELAPAIRVNAVCPGTVWSDNNARIIGRTMGLDRAGANADERIGGQSMLGRVADPDEIAKVVTFLASDDASFMTAANVVVDGGQTAL